MCALISFAAMEELYRGYPITGLEAVSFSGGNYMRAVEYGAWCVAFLNHGDRFAAPTYVERHNESDEVFVLLSGEATLLIGENRREVRMEFGKIYNVRKGTWHQIVTTPGTRCLIVENADTCMANSDRRDVAKL
jgi:mannose-6-phosphate isomerase-like protein (cupin superfamily)